MPRVRVTKDNAYVGMKVERASTWRWGNWRGDFTSKFKDDLGIITSVGESMCMIQVGPNTWNCDYDTDLIIAEQTFMTPSESLPFHEKLVQLGNGPRTGYVKELPNYTIGRLKGMQFTPLVEQNVQKRNDYIVNSDEIGPVWFVPVEYAHLFRDKLLLEYEAVPEQATTSVKQGLSDLWDAMAVGVVQVSPHGGTPVQESDFLTNNPIQNGKSRIVEVSTEIATISTGKRRHPSAFQGQGSTPAVSRGYISHRTVTGKS